MKENNPLTLLRVLCGPEGHEEVLDIDPQEYRIYLRHYYEEDGFMVQTHRRQGKAAQR